MLQELKISIVIGSQRRNSQSRKVGHYCGDFLKRIKDDKTKVCISSTIVDLAESRLPLWHQDSEDSSEEEEKKTWEKIKFDLESSHGFLFIVPEWGGMVPPVLKNLFLLVGSEKKGLFYHKPALIIAVSSGKNGAYPISELRMSSYKNNHILYLPDHVIVKEVEGVLNEKLGSGLDQYIRKRIEYSIRVLIEYSRSLNEIRKSGVLDRKNYPYGM